MVFPIFSPSTRYGSYPALMVFPLVWRKHLPMSQRRFHYATSSVLVLVLLLYKLEEYFGVGVGGGGGERPITWFFIASMVVLVAFRRRLFGAGAGRKEGERREEKKGAYVMSMSKLMRENCGKETRGQN